MTTCTITEDGRGHIVITWIYIELLQTFTALGGVVYGWRNYRAVQSDRWSAFRYGLPIDRETARANLESEVEKWAIQWFLLGFGLWSLAIAPTLPTVVDIWKWPDGPAVIMKQAVIQLLSVHLMWRSRRDRIARHRIMAFEADPEPATSLLERLGGRPAVKRIVVELYSRLLQDPVLAHYFEGKPLHHLMHAQEDFLTNLLSGHLSAADLRAAHAHLNISPEDFERFVDRFRDTLSSFKVPARLSQQVLDIILSTREQIVNRGPS